jgi:hypothetical protein
MISFSGPSPFHGNEPSALTAFPPFISMIAFFHYIIISGKGHNSTRLRPSGSRLSPSGGTVPK